MSIGRNSLWIASFIIALGAILPAICTIHEAFWIDELHSIWVARGPWEELASRAASGNQTVPYFAFLKFAYLLGSTEEWSIRTFSALAWGGAFGIGTYCLLRSTRPSDDPISPGSFAALIGLLFLWINLDWVSWFHAIEARPYALALLMTAIMIASSRKEENAPTSPINLVWTFAAASSVWLQPVTGMVVIASWLARLPWAFHANRELLWRSLSFRFGEVMLLAICWLPLVSNGLHLYARRIQWQSFAGDSGLLHLIQSYPLLPWLVVPGLGFVAAIGLKRQRLLPGDKFIYQLLWIAILPIGFAWLSTRLGWMPLMHRRYLLGSHLALFLLAGSMLIRIKSLPMLLVVGLLSAGLLVTQQGTWRHWNQGEWMGWQRFEGWDEAIEYINEHPSVEDRIYLAPMLIETTREPFARSTHPEYLQFAVKSAYPLLAPCSIEILSNSASAWGKKLEETSDGHGWLLIRSSSSRLSQALKPLEAKQPFWKAKKIERHDFGRVQLIRL